MPRRNDSIDWLRRDWYGMDRGRSEIAARQAAPVPIADALDQAVRSILPKSMVMLGKSGPNGRRSPVRKTPDTQSRRF